MLAYAAHSHPQRAHSCGVHSGHVRACPNCVTQKVCKCCVLVLGCLSCSLFEMTQFVVCNMQQLHSFANS